GARAATVDVALGKARTALYTRAPSAAFADRVRDNVNLLALGWMPLQGGLPLLYRDECVGAIGVSGVTAEQDEHVARAGCEALAALAK
ncbi:MAG: heme-binding protein, partial [Steroidobacteraceae bacterium]|nr:heme-binding protein [Steroidobacteraceae bacterium]